MYWRLYASPPEVREKLDAFRQRYNEVRGPMVLSRRSKSARVARRVQLPAWQTWAKAAKKKLEKLRVGQRQEVAISA